MQTATQRERHVIWQDPLPAAARAKELSGLDYLRAVQRGELPLAPIGHLLGIGLAAVEPGRVVTEAVAHESHYNPIGLVHGGLLATMLDSSMGCAVHSTLPAGVGYSTVQLQVHYVRPVTFQSGKLSCEGSVIYSGSRQATAEGRIVDAKGQLVAHGTTTCLILR
jgi:uncharacterized protein (TIGR00369 family)